MCRGRTSTPTCPRTLSKQPFATLGLILVCLVAAAFTLTDADTLLRYGYTPEPAAALPLLQRAISAVTSLFVHLDPFHLLANMLFLAAVGPAVERAAGWWRLLILFLVAGLVGVAAHHFASVSVLRATATEPLAGSSAALAGVVAYAGLRFHRARVPLLPKWYVPVWTLVIVWLALQGLGAWFSAAQFGSSVAFVAHLGGFVAGFGLALAFGAPKQADAEAKTDRIERAARLGESAHRAALDDLGTGDAVLRLARHLDDTGDTDGAIAKYLAVVGSSPVDAKAAAVLRLASLGKLSLIDEPGRLRTAQELERAHPSEAALLLQSVLDGSPENTTPELLARLVDLQAATDEASAKRAARRLVADFGPSPEAERIRLRYPELLG